MVPLSALGLPILLSAVFVFVASTVIHMVLQYHKNEYKKLPAEDSIREVMRGAAVTPGEYAIPRAGSLEDCGTPEMRQKYQEGPCGYVTIIPNGQPAVVKGLVLWFIYSAVISICVAYVTGRTLGPTAEYLAVFRLSGTVAFLAYAAAVVPNSIWKGSPWSTTLKHVLDGLIYGLVTGGVFGWLWPS
jgi:hypothetical protein